MNYFRKHIKHTIIIILITAIIFISNSYISFQLTTPQKLKSYQTVILYSEKDPPLFLKLFPNGHCVPIAIENFFCKCLCIQAA